MTQLCVFCGNPCFDFREGMEEGVAGKRIGNKIICEGCLDELKEGMGF